MVRRILSQGQIQPKTRVAQIKTPEIEELEKKLAKILKGKAKIELSQVQAKLSLVFRGDLDFTTDKIEKITRMLEQIFD